MKNIFKLLLLSAAVLVAGTTVSCTDDNENGGQFQGTPTIEVSPSSVTIGLEGGETEAISVATPASWTVTCDAEDVVASPAAGNGNAQVVFTVGESAAPRVIKVTFVATGYMNGFPIPKKDYLTISQGELPDADAFLYKDNCGAAVSKVDGYWPYVDKYEGWAPQGGEGLDQSGVTYTGSNASVRNSGKAWAPVGASYATDAPYAYIAKSGAYFQINKIALPADAKNLTFAFTAFNQYASLIDTPYTPAHEPLVSGSNVTLSVSLDGSGWAPVAFTTMADGNWEYAIAPFTLPEGQNATELYVKFSNYVANTSRALPDATYQYQAALRLDDFVLTKGGNGPVLDITNSGGDVPTPEPGVGPYASDVPFVCATDDSTNAAYSLGTTAINGNAATGFKLGKSKQEGKFTSAAVGVAGDKYLNFYAAAWKGSTATLYFRVDGGTVQPVELAANDGVTGNAPYVALTFAATDHHSIKLEGLTEASTIEFSTNADFALSTHSGSAPDIAPRVIVCGIKLTDEPIDAGTTPEPEPEPTPGETKTIAEILALGEGATISGSIEGVVVSNMALSNLTSKKGLYVQDETGALQFYLAANHELAFGTKVKIDLTGATLGAYNGAVQISGLALDKITTISTGNTVEAKSVTVADFLANKYEGQYIALEGIQVAASALANTWVVGGQHTSINVEDASGNKFVVFSSKYATYGAETVAQGSGTIKGISSINKGVMQIIFAQASDYAALTGARFDGTTVEPTPDPTPEPEPEPTPDPTPGDGTATTVTVTFHQMGYTNAQSVDGTNIAVDSVISLVFNKATANNAPAYYDASQGIRMYQNGTTLDVTANGKTITSIEFVFDYSQWYLGCDSGVLSAEGDTRTWTGEASAVKFTATGTDKTHRAYIKAMTISYK